MTTARIQQVLRSADFKGYGLQVDGTFDIDAVSVRRHNVITD
jgi:hypothetical protein